MRYKVGDKVRIRKDLVEKQYDGLCFVPSMAQYKGKVATIVSIQWEDCYEIDIDDKYWHWTDGMLEDVVSNSMTVEDLLNHTDIEKDGLIITVYYPNAYFEVTIGHNKINRNSELYKRFIDAYGDMTVDEVSFDIRNDCMVAMLIKVDYADAD